MKGTIVLVTNLQELREAEKVGIPCELIKEHSEMLFRPEHVTYACKTKHNHILLGIAGREMEIKFDQQIWDRLDAIMPH